MLKVQLIFPFFVDMQDSMEEVLLLLHKLLGELQFILFKKFLVPAAKKFGADLFESAAPEIGELVSGRKNSKHLQNMLEQNQFENSWEVEKRNPSVGLEEPFLEKKFENQSLSQRHF